MNLGRSGGNLAMRSGIWPYKQKQKFVLMFWLAMGIWCLAGHTNWRKYIHILYICICILYEKKNKKNITLPMTMIKTSQTVCVPNEKKIMNIQKEGMNIWSSHHELEQHRNEQHIFVASSFLFLIIYKFLSSPMWRGQPADVPMCRSSYRFFQMRCATNR